MGKKIRLADIEGQIGGINRRAVLNELLLNKYTFETKLMKSIKKYVIFLITMIVILGLAIITYTIGYEKAWENGYKYCINEVYIKGGGK